MGVDIGTNGTNGKIGQKRRLRSMLGGIIDNRRRTNAERAEVLGEITIKHKIQKNGLR